MINCERPDPAVQQPEHRMTPSAFIPSFSGWIALVAGFVVAICVPPLIPAYDGPGVSWLQCVIAIVLATVTLVICLRCFHKGRTVDRIAAFLVVTFAALMFYEFVRRVT